MVVADVADEKGKALEQELDVRYVRTDATDEADVRAAMAEADAMGPLRISVDTHGGPAIGGRLLGKDGEPLDLAGFRKTIEFYLTGVFNVMRLAAAAIARQELLTAAAVSSSAPRRSRPTRARSASSPTPPPRAAW